MTSRATISAFVVCCNEERLIGQCLRSLSFCDEVIVVDSGSTDATVRIASELGARVVHNPWPGFVEQKRFGLSLCSKEWVLNLDADEEISPELRAEIEGRLANTPPSVDGFELNRVVYFLSRWWRSGGWYPEYRLRLCRRERTSWGGENPHEKASVPGQVVRLSGEVRHYTYDSLSDQLSTLNRFSLTSAQSMHARGRTAGVVDLIARPIARFFKFYVLKRGFLEGAAGFIVAVTEAYSVFAKYSKLIEIQRGWSK